MADTFPQSKRLKKPFEFKNVWTKGRRLSANGVAIANCQNDLTHPRLGLSISKKQIRNAVDRNRIKRIARETFRHIQPELGGRDFIVMAYKGMDKLPPKEQYQRLEALWKRLIDIFKKPA